MSPCRCVVVSLCVADADRNTRRSVLIPVDVVETPQVDRGVRAVRPGTAASEGVHPKNASAVVATSSASTR